MIKLYIVKAFLHVHIWFYLFLWKQCNKVSDKCKIYYKYNCIKDEVMNYNCFIQSTLQESN